MNERIKELRKALHLTQQDFSNRIGTKRNTVAQYEIGRIEPSTAVVSLICREFHVSETWLRTGEGEMFTQQSRGEAIRAFVDDLLNDQEDSFRLHFVSCLTKLTDHEWTVLANLAERLASEGDLFFGHSEEKEMASNGSEKRVASEDSEPSVEELEAEYKKRASGSASTGDSPASSSTGDASGVA